MSVTPLLRFELAAEARRRRNYLLRSAYGLLLLLMLWARYWGATAWSEGRTLSIRETAEFAGATTGWLLVVQLLGVAILTPAVFAGAIAEARQRGTLDLLLAGRMGAVEIVVGQVAARLAHVLEYLLLGLPVLTLTAMFGGVDPGVILLATAGTASTAVFLAGLSALVSAHARRPNGALWATYAIALAWLFGPGLIGLLLARSPALTARFGPINDWLYAVGPLSLLSTWAIDPLLARGSLNLSMTIGLRMVGLQLALGGVMLLLAAWRLRPMARALADGPTRRGRRRARRRPPCGDRPMLWKELHASGGRGLATLPMLAVAAAIAVFWWRAWSNWNFGYMFERLFDNLARGDWGAIHYEEEEVINRHLGRISSIFYGAWVLLVASGAATGVASERERATWTGLLTTPLDGREIVSAKMRGALRGTLPILALILAPWMFSFALGALHPLGLLAGLVGLAVQGWFASALGTYLSLRARSTGQALAWTLGLLLALNLAPVLLFTPVVGLALAAGMGFSPAMIDRLPFSRLQFAYIRHSGSLDLVDPGYYLVYIAPTLGEGRIVIALSAILTLAYAVGAAILTRGAIRRFDEAADRPRRAGTVPGGDRATSRGGSCSPALG